MVDYADDFIHASRYAIFAVGDADIDTDDAVYYAIWRPKFYRHAVAPRDYLMSFISRVLRY